MKTLEKEEVNKREQELKKEETDSGQKGRAPSLRDEARRGTHEEMLLKSDYSCLAEKREVMPPVLPHARSNLRFMSLEGQPRLYVQYRCNRIARMSERTEVPFMYCQNGTWVGEVPVCVLRGECSLLRVNFFGEISLLDDMMLSLLECNAIYYIMSHYQWWLTADSIHQISMGYRI